MSGNHSFFRGLGCLEEHNLSFDLQTNPKQMKAWASTLAKLPNGG
jgi:predicted TIM-barrel fold metal-dependent hydrolase